MSNQRAIKGDRHFDFYHLAASSLRKSANFIFNYHAIDQFTDKVSYNTHMVRKMKRDDKKFAKKIDGLIKSIASQMT